MAGSINPSNISQAILNELPASNQSLPELVGLEDGPNSTDPALIGDSAFLGTWEAQLSAGFFAFAAMGICFYQIYCHLLKGVRNLASKIECFVKKHPKIRPDIKTPSPYCIT